MKWKNASSFTVTISQLGIGPIKPGEEVEIDDKHSLRRPTTGVTSTGRDRTLPALIVDLSGGYLVPAAPEDQERYDTLTVEDLEEVKAAHRGVLLQEFGHNRYDEAGKLVHLGVESIRDWEKWSK